MNQENGLSERDLLGAIESCLEQGQLDTVREALRHLIHELQVHELELEIQNRELRNVQIELERSRDRYAHLFDFAPIGYLILDGRGVIQEVNLTGAAMTGYERRLLVGYPFTRFLSKEGRLVFLSCLRECRSAGRKLATELVLIGKEGSGLPVRLYIEAAESDPVNGCEYRMAMVDLREQRQAEELAQQAVKLQAINVALQAADRRKTEFIAVLSHELRNPLAPILAAVQALQRMYPSEPRSGRLMEVIHRQVKHLARLVDDLLDVSRITRDKIRLNRQAVELTRLVNDALENVQPLMEARQHRLTVTLPDPPVRLMADPVRLVQVIENLLANAAKYTPAGGWIHLSARREAADVMLSIRDNGIGIAPEMLPRIFDLFTQADQGLDRSAGGLGIGLHIVKRLVEMHGGRVEAGSEGQGKGSEFRVWLPVLSDWP